MKPGAAFLLPLSLVVACTALEITLDAGADAGAGRAGTGVGGESGARGESGAGGEERGGSGRPAGAGASATAGAVSFVCAPDNWTSDEFACSRGEPAPSCDGTIHDWFGCRGTGCAVCEEELAEYPYYFDRHPCCEPQTKCDGERNRCNVACPPPEEFDKTPLCPPR